MAVINDIVVNKIVDHIRTEPAHTSKHASLSLCGFVRVFIKIAHIRERHVAYQPVRT